MPKAMRSEGHPWLQRPSGSTMQPSVQQAGEVPSNIAWRAYAKAPSSEGSQPSFSSASMALIRYGLRVAVGTCVVFIWFVRASIARATYGVAPIGCPDNSHTGRLNEMPTSGSVDGNENGTDTRTGTRAGLTIDAWGPVAIRSAQLLETMVIEVRGNTKG